MLEQRAVLTRRGVVAVEPELLDVRVVLGVAAQDFQQRRLLRAEEADDGQVAAAVQVLGDPGAGEDLRAFQPPPAARLALDARGQDAELLPAERAVARALQIADIFEVIAGALPREASTADIAHRSKEPTASD